jgi:hypothetical protein
MKMEKKISLCCMDNRIQEWDICIAGSGILLATKVWVEKTIGILENLWVNEITSHSDCLAAKIYAKAKWIAEKKIWYMRNRVFSRYIKKNVTAIQTYHIR